MKQKIKNYKKAVVLLNMGGVSKKGELEIFLTNMFNDENIITVKSDRLRSFIASMIVRFRRGEASENYESINNASPILRLTRSLVKKLQKKFGAKDSSDTLVTFAMRYTPPYADSAVKQLKKYKIKEVFLLPLYPQYSTTTVKSSLEEIMPLLDRALPLVKISYIKRFYQNKSFVKLIAHTIANIVPDKDKIKNYSLLFSAHSLPQKIITRGDSYEIELNAQIKLIKKELEKQGLLPREIILAYQSKLGPIKWLGPSLEHTIRNFVGYKNKKGKEIKKVIVYPISFTIDNAETTFELSIEAKELAEKNGFNQFIVCPSPNDSDEFVEILHKMSA